MSLEQAKTHKKFGYPIITGSIALAMTADEFASLAPAQRGFVNRHRRLSGVEPFPRPDLAAGGVRVEMKAKPVAEQLVAAVETAREEERLEPEAVPVKRKPAKKPKASKPRKGAK